ncbi:MAG: hypothetical protein MJB14_10350 [Spirochaetes bacterium]|nr:hypothetical protein [Spirochaetota bacterium]
MRLIDEIVNVYEKKGNEWLDYNEIYEQMDKSLFSKNKHGERGKRNIVYRILLSYENLFDIDDKYRPKKFRLSSTKSQNEVNTEKKYSTGESKIRVDRIQYNEIEFSIESDFEEEVKSNYQFIFGENSYYYDIKKKIGNRICDAIVFDEELNKVIIVENELFIHDLWGHIIPQIIDFFTAMLDDKIKMNLKYNVKWNDNHKLPIIEAIDRQKFDIMVIIDKINFEIKKARRDINQLIGHFVQNQEIKIYFKEYRVYINDSAEKVYFIS